MAHAEELAGAVAVLDSRTVSPVALAEDFEGRFLKEMQSLGVLPQLTVVLRAARFVPRAAAAAAAAAGIGGVLLRKLIAGFVESFADESKPSRCRLVVFDHQHIASIQRDYLLKPEPKLKYQLT